MTQIKIDVTDMFFTEVIEIALKEVSEGGWSSDEVKLEVGWIEKSCFEFIGDNDEPRVMLVFGELDLPLAVRRPPLDADGHYPIAQPFVPDPITDSTMLDLPEGE